MTDAGGSSASESWSRELRAWSIPDEILDKAPESPWGFPVPMFRRSLANRRGRDTPSKRVELASLSPGSAVLDVGSGAGAASLPLAPPASRLVAVDESADMLAAFSDEANAAGLAHDEVEGRWPDVADKVDTADLVVCHHVFYNVAELPPFVDALAAHARKRVVVELTGRHPMTGFNDLWLHFHDLERPSGPSAEDALAVLREMGLEPEMEISHEPSLLADLPRDEFVAFARRRLCLPAERDPEISELLKDTPMLGQRPIATLWWEGAA